MSKKFLITGLILLGLAIGFIAFALNNPMATSPFGYEATWVFYKIYFVIMVSMFILSIIFAVISAIKRRRKK